MGGFIDFFKDLGTGIVRWKNNGGPQALLGGIAQALPGGTALAGATDAFLTAQSEAEAREYNKNMLDYQNAYNTTEAQKQRDWEEMMSNTAVQRRMADISSAGLNPWISVEQEASTPAGATASTAATEAAKRINFNVFTTGSKENNKIGRTIIQGILGS